MTLKTAFYMRHKILSKYYENEQLDKLVEIGETYFGINLKGTRKEKMPRKSQKRGGGSSLRGVSNHQVCVVTAIDSQDRAIVKISNLGNPKIEEIDKIIDGKIHMNSTIITDSKTAYIKFAEKNKLVLKQIPSGSHIKGDYNLANINNLHSKMKSWLAKFRGVSTKHLQYYLDWYRYHHYQSYRFEYKEKKNQMYHYCMLTELISSIKSISERKFPIDLSEVYGEYKFNILACNQA